MARYASQFVSAVVVPYDPRLALSCLVDTKKPGPNERTWLDWLAFLLAVDQSIVANVKVTRSFKLGNLSQLVANLSKATVPESKTVTVARQP